jgi:hypothetical protein
MTSREAWVERYKVILRDRGKAQALGVESHIYLIRIRECFVRAKICN